MIQKEDLEEAAIEAFKQIVDSDKNNFLEIFKAGALWQKEQGQSTIELAEDHAYLAGQEKVINKACEWLEENLLSYWQQQCTDTTSFINSFKIAMEE